MADFAGRLQVAPASKSNRPGGGRRGAAGQIVFLDGGTTAVQLARHLAPDLQATVVAQSEASPSSWSIIPASRWSDRRAPVQAFGRRSRAAALEAIGASDLDCIYFMGVTGVHAEHGLTTGDGEEAAVKRTLCRLAAESDRAGIERETGRPVALPRGAARQVNMVVTDGEVADALKSRLGSRRRGGRPEAAPSSVSCLLMWTATPPLNSSSRSTS